jgi:hypothetical protein
MSVNYLAAPMANQLINLPRGLLAVYQNISQRIVHYLLPWVGLYWINAVPVAGGYWKTLQTFAVELAQ